jgi:sigma-E factor negative regulatory protein RseA
MDRISALMDGELEPQEARRLLVGLKSDPELKIRWDEFHLVRDALHAEPLLSSRFSEGLSQRLAAEPTILAPQRRILTSRRAATYAMSAAASACAVAFVAWVAVGGQDSPEATPIAAKEPAPEPLRSVPSDGRMSEYLLAHEGFSPSTALQGLAPYIRTVSTRSADRR